MCLRCRFLKCKTNMDTNAKCEGKGKDIERKEEWRKGRKEERKEGRKEGRKKGRKEERQEGRKEFC